MRLIAKAIMISRAKFHCNRLTTIQDIRDYASISFLRHSIYRDLQHMLHDVESTCVQLVMLVSVYN